MGCATSAIAKLPVESEDAKSGGLRPVDDTEKLKLRGSKILPQVDLEAPVSPALPRPLLPVEPACRQSTSGKLPMMMIMRGSTDGNLDVFRGQASGDLPLKASGIRVSTDGNVAWPGPGPPSPLLGGSILFGVSAGGTASILRASTGNVTGLVKSSPHGNGSLRANIFRGPGRASGGGWSTHSKGVSPLAGDKDDDDLEDADYCSDDVMTRMATGGGGDGRSDGPSESIMEFGNNHVGEVMSAPNLTLLMGGQVLMSSKALLSPSKVLRSPHSQLSLAAGLPAVKPNGHRSIVSRSIGGPSNLLAAAFVDAPSPLTLNVASSLGNQTPVRMGSVLSANGGGLRISNPGVDDPGEHGDLLPRSRLGRPIMDPGDLVSPSTRSRLCRSSMDPGPADEVLRTAGDNMTSKKALKRGGREWDNKGGRWRRASVFQSAAHCAISLRFLRRLLTDYVVPLAKKLNIPVGQVTTAMVNEMVVKVLTKEQQCRLVDMPGLVPLEDVGEPDYFISHAWGNPFAHLVQCVCDHLSGALDSTKVWIDIAAVNQHPTDQQMDDLANLRTAIFKSKATLMCLDVTGAPLKRVWCLYECDNTITIHGPDRLVLLTPNFSVKDMASVFTSINVIDAGAYKQSDKDKILEDIVAHHGSTTAFDNKLKLLFLFEPLDMQADLEALLEGTGGAQEHDFSPLQMWLTSPRSPQVCVISGPAGCGKSTISAALCWDEKAKMRRDKTLARVHAGKAQARGQDAPQDPIAHAYHFCKYSDVRRQSPIRIVKTLAYQLAQRLPLLRSYYAELDVGQVQQLHQASTAFRLLLLKPLTTLLPRDEQVVLLIDAMDEADTPSQLPLDNSVLQLMLHQLSNLPRNVRVITSTRSAPHLMGPLRRTFNGSLELTPAMVRKRETTLLQLERRLASRFGSAAAAVMLGSGGGENNLTYYYVVMLLDPSLEVVPDSLPACYKAVFEAAWQFLTAQQRAEVVKVLQVLMAAQEPLQLSLLAGLGLDHILEQLPGWGVLLYEREYRVYTLHKSLYEWLSDQAAAGDFYADPRVGHCTLGRYLFNAAHPRPAYGAKYLVTHLLAAGDLKALLDQVVTDMDYLEAVCRVGYVFRLHAELAMVEPKSRAVADMVRWLGLNSHVLWAHPAAVVQLANEAPNSSAFMIALRRRRRTNSVVNDAAGATKSSSDATAGTTLAPATLLNKHRSWPAQLSILAQHHRAVNSVSFNPAGTLLASGSEDRSIRLWDPLTGEQKAVLFGHKGQVLGVAFSPNDFYIASASVDSTVRIWDATTGEEKAELTGHVDWVRDVAFAPAAGAAPGSAAATGRLLASCGDDKTVRVWDLSGTQPQTKFTMLGHTDAVSCVCFSPDGKYLASGSSDLSIRLWDPNTGRQAGRALVAHKFPVMCACFSPDGKYIASGSSDKLILLWDMAEAVETGVPAVELAGHTDKVLSLNFSPDSNTLLSASADGSIRLWDVPARRVKGVLLGHAGSVVAAAFSPSGQLVASAASDYTVRLWDPRVACENGSVEETSLTTSHTDTVTHIAFSRSGDQVASAGADWTVRLWDPSNGHQRALLQGHTDVVRCVAFSPTGHLLASASSDWTVRLWDPVSKAEKGTLTGHQDRVLAVAWSPNSRMLASACHSGNIVVWDAITMSSRLQIMGHLAPVNCLAFSPNSKVLASGSSDTTLRLWNTQLGEQQVLIRGHTGAVHSAEYDTSGKLLTSFSLEERLVRVWDPASGVLLSVITNASLCSPGAFSMYSLARHAPFVRAIVFKTPSGTPLICNTSPVVDGDGGGAAGSTGAPTAASGSGHVQSSALGKVLRTSMTLGPDRHTPNGLVAGGQGGALVERASDFDRQPATPPLSGFGAAASSTTTGAVLPAVGSGAAAAGAGMTTSAPLALRSAISMDSSMLPAQETPPLVELVSEADNPSVPIFTSFVSPKCVAVHGNKVVMSDGPFMYFYESDEGTVQSWKNRLQWAKK